MDRRLQRDQQLEGTAKPTEKAKKAGPPPWELEKYIYQESSTDDGRPSHSDPRLELAQRIHSQHQDSAFIPSDDDDSKYGYPAFGSGFTSHLDANASSASEWGTLAGGGCCSKPQSDVASDRDSSDRPDPTTPSNPGTPASTQSPSPAYPSPTTVM
jgi:hypothetical protein